MAQRFVKWPDTATWTCTNIRTTAAYTAASPAVDVTYAWKVTGGFPSESPFSPYTVKPMDDADQKRFEQAWKSCQHGKIVVLPKPAPPEPPPSVPVDVYRGAGARPWPLECHRTVLRTYTLPPTSRLRWWALAVGLAMGAAAWAVLQRT